VHSTWTCTNRPLFSFRSRPCVSASLLVAECQLPLSPRRGPLVGARLEAFGLFMQGGISTAELGAEAGPPAADDEVDVAAIGQTSPGPRRLADDETTARARQDVADPADAAIGGPDRGRRFAKRFPPDVRNHARVRC
jgi:hypothetical protein